MAWANRPRLCGVKSCSCSGVMYASIHSQSPRPSCSRYFYSSSLRQRFPFFFSQASIIPNTNNHRQHINTQKMSGIQEKMTTALASKDQGNEAFKNGDIKKGRKEVNNQQPQQWFMAPLYFDTLPQRQPNRIRFILTKRLLLFLQLTSSCLYVVVLFCGNNSFDTLPLGKIPQLNRESFSLENASSHYHTVFITTAPFFLF